MHLLSIFNIHVLSPPQGADKDLKAPNGDSAFDAADSDVIKALFKWDTQVWEVWPDRWVNGQTDGCSGPLTEDGLAPFTLINLCLNTAFVCLLEGHFVCLVIFLTLFSPPPPSPKFCGIGFSLLLASVCSHLTGLVSYVSLRDQSLGEHSHTWILKHCKTRNQTL